jgi:hypothetical protein
MIFERFFLLTNKSKNRTNMITSIFTTFASLVLEENMKKVIEAYVQNVGKN